MRGHPSVEKRFRRPIGEPTRGRGKMPGKKSTSSKVNGSPTEGEFKEDSRITMRGDFMKEAL